MRSIDLLLALVGLVLVVWLVARGRDVQGEAGAISWRGRALAAALALLALVGLPPAAAADVVVAPLQIKLRGPVCRAALEGSAEWKRLLAVWAEAAEIGAGKRGAYPFDEAGKKKLLAALQQAITDLEGLVKAGKLTSGEAELLKQDLLQLTSGVAEKRPTEMRAATCYQPRMLPNPVQQSGARLAARLPLLEKLVGEKRLEAVAVRKALEAVERDLAVIDRPGNSRKTIDQIKRARRAVARLRAACK
jgi:hypothetical protein